MKSEDARALPRLHPAPRILVVIAAFYREIAEMQLAGATATLEAAGAPHRVVEVPGALEIPTAIRLAARSGRYEGHVALGCVIRGETTHYETVCAESARGLTLLGLEGIAIGNGILTCETMDQAVARADPGGMDKAGGAAAAALRLVELAREFSPRGSVPPEGSDVLIAGASAHPRTA